MKLAFLLAPTVLIACAAPPVLRAHLAEDPNRLAVGTPKFSGCPDCPAVRYQLPSGAYESVTISTDPIYTLAPSDLTSLRIYERRSPLVLGAISYVAIAEPSAQWLSSTEGVRESYPDDSIAWLEDDRLRVVTFNVNSRVQGAFWVAVFSCENDALAFSARMRGSTSIIPQSEEEYRAEVAEWNAHYARIPERLRTDPSALESSGLSTADFERLASEGVPEFPVSPESFYGPGHELPKCE